MANIELSAADLAAAGDVFGLWVEQGRGTPEWGILSIAAIIARHMAPEREGIAVADVKPNAADLAAVHEIYATQPDFEAVAAIIAKHLEPERERARRLEDVLNLAHTTVGLLSSMILSGESFTETSIRMQEKFYAEARAALEKS